MLEAAGGVSAPQPRQMTDAEEIAEMKRDIAAARARAAAEAALKAQQAAAAADAANKKKAATTALGVYNDKMLHHQNQWVAQNRGKYTTQAAAQQAWLNAWQNSTEGQNAEKELAPYLADYNAAVKKELRLSAADAELTGGNVKAAVQNTAAGLKSGGNTFQDKVLNDVIDKASGQIANETPEVRHAVLNVYTAIDNYQTALTNQKNLQDSLDKALQGVHNMGLRQEIRDSFTADLNAAQTAVDNSAQALKDAGDLELAVTLSQNVLADVNKLPMGIRRAEPELVSDARQQYQDALNGKFDLKDYSPDQLQAALESVLGNHPEYMTDGYSDFTLHLMEVDNALKMRPTLDMNLDTLSIGKNSPQWMQDLVNKGDKVTAALIVSMGMQNEQPQGGDEKLLAEKDPLAFAILRYSGAHFQMPAATINNVQPSEADIVSAGETAAAKAFQALQTSADKTSQGKAMDLQGLLFASGYVRADYIKQQWQDFAATHSTKQSLDQILDDYLDDKDFNNPNATPTSDMGKFVKMLRVNLNACITPEQQALVWGGISGDVTTYINQQADYIKAHYSKEDGYAAAIGEWQKQLGQFAPQQLANVVTDVTISHFDPTLIGQHGGGRMVDGLQILADRSTQSANSIANWVTSVKGQNAYQVPLNELVTVKHDGTGANLGNAILTDMRMAGVDEYGMENLQSNYDYGLKDAQKKMAGDAGKAQFDLFNTDRNHKLQSIFDNAIANSGDLYTTKHIFGNDPVADNKYGNMLGLPADNPQAGPGQAQYTDPAKLAKIHELKQIDLLSRALSLPVDLTSLIPAIVSGDKLPDSENLTKINMVREWIKSIGGDNALVSFMPAVYNSPDQGPMVINLIRVEGDKNNDGVITRDATTQTAGRGAPSKQLDDEDMIIDTTVLDSAVTDQNVSFKYDDFKAFQEQNALNDKGKLYMSGSADMLLHDDNGDHHVDNINFAGVDAAITTGWEHITQWGDRIAAVAGAAAGIALVVGTGGLAAPLVMAATTGYFLLRTAQTGTEMADHGQSIWRIWNPHADGAILGLFDPAAFQFWSGAIASASGLAALRPLALADSFMALRGGAALSKDAALTTGLRTELFGRNGLQSNIYRAGLNDKSSLIARLIAPTARFSGIAQSGSQVWSFGNIYFSGKLNGDNVWDGLLMLAGVAPWAAGHFARQEAQIRAAATEIPQGDIDPATITVDPTNFTREQQGWLTVDQMRSMTAEQLAALSVDQLKGFTFRQRNALSHGQMRLLDTEQMNALMGRVLDSPLGNIPFADAPVPYGEKPLETNKPIYHTGNLRGFTNDQLAAIPPDELVKYHPLSVRSLRPDQIAALTPEQFAALSLEHLTWLTDAQMVAITPEQLAAMDPRKLGEFSPEQRALLTANQKSLLNAAQLGVLDLPWFNTPFGRVSMPDVVPHKFNDFAPETTFAGLPEVMNSSAANEVSMLMILRSIRLVESHLGAEAAATVLNGQQNILLLTGFNVARNMPETDGPPGTALLGQGLRALGKDVTYAVPDEFNGRVLKAVLEDLGEPTDNVIVFQSPDDASALPLARSLLADINPDTVFAIETPSPNTDHVMSNMFGLNITDFNGHLYAIFRAAQERPEIVTMGVGDGGNELGMGNLKDFVPPARNGNNMTAADGADITITSSVSNLGAVAVRIALSKLNRDPSLLPTVDQYLTAIEAAARAGAVDGVTRLPIASVDGFVAPAHAGWLVNMLDANNVPTDHVEPIRISLMDSSSGGMYAARTMARMLEDASGRRVQLILGLDHGMAPYGPRDMGPPADPLAVVTPENTDVGTLTNNVLKVIQRNGQIVVMACNTASQSTGFANDITLAVINLVDTTAHAMAGYPGNKIVSLSTSGMANSHGYSDRVARLNTDIRVQEIGASAPEDLDGQRNMSLDLADLVNNMNDPDKAASPEAIQAAVDHYVSLMDPDTDSVWLTCTHYPALTDQIETAVKNRTDWGPKGRPEIIDPMIYQVRAVSEALGIDIVDRASPRYLASQPPVIITSADNAMSRVSADVVLNDARNIFGRQDVRMVSIDDFGTLANETSQSQTSRDIWLQIHRPNYPSDGTLNSLSIEQDGKLVPVESLIRQLELQTAKQINEDPKTKGSVMNAYEDFLRAMGGYGPVDRPPVEQPTGPTPGGGGRFRIALSVLKEFGPTAGASVALGLVFPPQYLAVVNGTSWIVRGVANVPILVAPGTFAPDTMPGKIARGVIAVTFIGNASYHNLSFETGTGTPFNQFYAISDHGSLAQNVHDVRVGRAEGLPNWAKYTTLASANVANTSLLLLSSIPAGPAAWIPNLLFGGATAYTTYRAARGDIATRQGVELPPAKVATKIASAASILGLTAFGLNYLASVAFPNLKKLEDQDKKRQPLPTNTPTPTITPLPSFSPIPSGSPSPTPSGGR